MSSKPTLAVGIIGIGYGQQVLLPSFAKHPACTVVALAASTAERARAVGDRFSVPMAFAGWQALVDAPGVDAVAVAVAPSMQPEVTLAALARGKPVFCEKPIAASRAGGETLVRAAAAAAVANVVDFLFPEIPAWRRAKDLLAAGSIGTLRHVVVHWAVETYTNRAGIDSWKARTGEGGGALSNFCSQTFHYLEWLLGPVVALRAHLGRTPNDPRAGDTMVVLALEFSNGMNGAVTLLTDAPLARRHRIEIYGDRGALVLDNDQADYVRGFRLWKGERGDGQLAEVIVEEPSFRTEAADGRVDAASRIVDRFVTWATGGASAHPDLRDGLRVQVLIDGAQRSQQDGTRVVIA